MSGFNYLILLAKPKDIGSCWGLLTFRDMVWIVVCAIHILQTVRRSECVCKGERRGNEKTFGFRPKHHISGNSLLCRFRQFEQC